LSLEKATALNARGGPGFRVWSEDGEEGIVRASPNVKSDPKNAVLDGRKEREKRKRRLRRKPARFEMENDLEGGDCADEGACSQRRQAAARSLGKVCAAAGDGNRPVQAVKTVSNRSDSE
jgi:hypothetical protein